jgi:hypothetical protein
MEKLDAKERGRTGNDRYEGFAMDLAEAIARIVGFNYSVAVTTGYGSLDANTGEWNGMIKELLEEVSSKCAYHRSPMPCHWQDHLKSQAQVARRCNSIRGLVLVLARAPKESLDLDPTAAAANLGQMVFLLQGMHIVHSAHASRTLDPNWKRIYS